MRCPFCTSTDTSVLESRVGTNGDSLRRRRECHKCERRFTTYERIEGPSLMVIKKDNRREPFDFQKLAKGIRRAFHKRAIAVKDIETLVDAVERELLRKGNPEIPSKTIGKICLRRIKKLDKVAWLRFASIYLEFENLSDFQKAINK